MSKPICVKCQIEFTMQRDILVVETRYVGADRVEEPYRIWQADLWSCRACGCEIVHGFGGRPLWFFSGSIEEYQKHLSQAASEGKQVIYSFERPQAKGVST